MTLLSVFDATGRSNGLMVLKGKLLHGLKDGSVIAVIGAGPAGSFFSLLALQEAHARGIQVRPVLFDGKSFVREGPLGCNMCAGVISWKLVQEIEEFGLRIPQERVQRLIHSYVFHTREGSHTVISPPGRGPIPVVFRGNGPRFSRQIQRISFDDFLLEQVLQRGAEIIPSYVDSISFSRDPGERPRVYWSEGELTVDLVVIACGVTTLLGKQLAKSGIGYRFPHCVRAFQAELDLGDVALEDLFGDNIHVFSLGLSDIRFAAIIPKTRFATVTLVGDQDLTNRHLLEFLNTPTVKKLLPHGWKLPNNYCHCRPQLPVKGAKGFYWNRLLFIGDASMSRYYKNGIDSAFHTARFAVQAVFDSGLSAGEIRKSYVVFVRREFWMENVYARILFRLNDFVATRRFWIHAHMYLVRNQPSGRTAQTLHFVTWNLFTGDAPYREILRAILGPRFLSKMILTSVRQLFFTTRKDTVKESPLRPAQLSPRSTPLGPLEKGQTVAIVGGGPGGACCGIALKRMAAERGINIRVVLYEGKVFENGRHYNQCAGVLSTPIDVLLKRDLGIDFPFEIVQRTIRSYRLCGLNNKGIHLSSGTHRSYAVRRSLWDEFMINQARKVGIEVYNCRLAELESTSQGVTLYADNGTLEADVVVGAFGLDHGSAAIFGQWIGYRRPEALETIVTNIYASEDWVDYFGNDILAFLPKIAGVSFGAITPKKNHLTVNIAGLRVNSKDMKMFLRMPEVKRWLPPGHDPEDVTHQYYKGSFPNRPARLFFADRFVAVGDAAGLVRPFKGKGVTSACLSGIAAAKVMLDYGISRKAFLSYRQACQPILSDRHFGWAMQKLSDAFRVTGSVDALLNLAHKDPGLRRALFLSVSGEESYRKIFRDGFEISRAARILREIIREKVSSVYGTAES